MENNIVNFVPRKNNPDPTPDSDPLDGIIASLIEILNRKAACPTDSPKDTTNRTDTDPDINIENNILTLDEISTQIQTGKIGEHNTALIKKSLIIHIIEDFGKYTEYENEVLSNIVNKMDDTSLDLLIRCRDIQRIGKTSILSLPRMEELQNIFQHLQQGLDQGLPPEEICSIIDNLLFPYYT